MLSRSRKVRAEETRRARIVLGLASGEGIWALSRRLEVSVNTISLWRNRFAQERLSGFFSRHPGRRPTEDSALVEARIIDWTLHRKPADGFTHWSSRKLASALGVNQSRIARV